jgi:hypothetical protein
MICQATKRRPARSQVTSWALSGYRPGDALFDGGVDYVIERVEPAPNPMSFGHAWARRRDD